MGDYHTHGDYSNSEGRTEPEEDTYGSDDFSRGDVDQYHDEAESRGIPYVGYLGTPSGTYLKYDTATGETTVL